MVKSPCSERAQIKGLFPVSPVIGYSEYVHHQKNSLTAPPPSVFRIAKADPKILVLSKVSVKNY